MARSSKDSSASGEVKRGERAWSLPAIRGVQGRALYYVAMVRLGDVPRLIAPVDPRVAPENRAQRTLNRARVPKIAQYVLGNPATYTFSALTGSVDGVPTFQPAGGDKHAKMGVLEIPAGMPVSILDGQHRRAAIEVALSDPAAQKTDLANESIALVLFVDTGLARAQQRFADLNRFPVRVNGSLGVLYDHRDEHAMLAKAVARGVPVFAALTEGERASCAGRSGKLFSLSGIHAATRDLLAGAALKPKDAERTAIEFWNAVALTMRPWRDAADGKVPAAKLREEFVHAHAVGLQAIGRAGRAILQLPDWKSAVAKLGTAIDWRRGGGTWEGRAMVGGQMSKSAANVALTANAIKTALGIELTPEDRTFENALVRVQDAPASEALAAE
jgi:DNA sulfur modification protein DndB